MKILELTNFSAGICGVWARVKEESKLLKNLGHDVTVFSSTFTKGSTKKASSEEVVEGLNIRRFEGTKLGGESFMRWFTTKAMKEAIKFNPDVIIAHGYRHPHTRSALKLGKYLGARVLLVTHAPFVDNNETRSIISKCAVGFYDLFIGPKTLNKFDKIITITRWEEPYLRKLGALKEKLVYIPNGIPQKYFSMKKGSLQKNKVLFFGRISPIKNIEVLIESFGLLKTNHFLEIVGPAEEDYLKKLKKLVNGLNLQDRITFKGPVYKIEEKISLLDSAQIFILPSKREAMPQALIEAMARGVVCIASENKGSKEIIKNGYNGYLFKNGNARDLADKINKVPLKNQEIAKNASISVRKFEWNIIVKNLEKIIDKNN